MIVPNNCRSRKSLGMIERMIFQIAKISLSSSISQFITSSLRLLRFGRAGDEYGYNDRG